MSIKPFYQGQLDVFCAIYAVLNALHQTHGIGVGQARRILNETLIDLARDPELFRITIWNETDYAWLVEGLIERCGIAPFALEAIRPFHEVPEPSPRALWQEMEAWLEGGARRTAIFRFRRYLPFRGDPIVQHWSTVEQIIDDELFLRDSSHEQNAIRGFRQADFVTRHDELGDGRLLLVEPASLWLLQGVD